MMTATTQVILDGQRVGSISTDNLASFLRVTSMRVVVHTSNAISLVKG